MSEFKMRRRCVTFPAVLSTTTASATTLHLEDFAGAVIDMGTIATAVTTLTVHAASSDAGPYRPLYSDAGVAVAISLAPSTTAGRVYAMPDAAFALPYAKLVANNSGAEGVPATVTIKS